MTLFILLLNLQITTSDIMPHIKLAVSLVIAYGYFNLNRCLCGYVCVDMYMLTYALYHTRRGNITVAVTLPLTVLNKGCKIAFLIKLWYFLFNNDNKTNGS